MLYLGHTDLLNIEAAATIDVVGAPALGDGAAWEYWGKDAKAAAADADPRWRPLTAKPSDLKPDTLMLAKPSGAVEPTTVGSAESRWLRAHSAHLDSNSPLLETDAITLRVNALPPTAQHPPSLDDPAKFSELPPVEAVVNTTPSPPNNFYPLGREPRMFDTLYLGCAEAFSKAGATAWMRFTLSDGVFTAMSAIDGVGIGRVVAGVDTSGALHLFQLAANGQLTRLPAREPMTPAEGVSLVTGVPPVMWMEGSNLHVAVATRDQVYAWKEVFRTSRG